MLAKYSAVLKAERTVKRRAEMTAALLASSKAAMREVLMAASSVALSASSWAELMVIEKAGKKAGRKVDLSAGTMAT